MKKGSYVSILGDGGWGTALSIILYRNGYKVKLWSAFEEYARFLDKKRVNSKFLKGIHIPYDIIITSNLKEALDFCNTIILAIPSQHIRGVLNRIKKAYLQEKVFLSVVKGIENRSLKRMSEVIYEELGNVNLAVLSGPNISFEIAKSIPSVSVVASKNSKIARYFQDILMNDHFRIYTNDDVTGVELGGSLKNVIALACGISDGMGHGTNTKAALITRGLVEISKLGKAMGAKKETFYGASGLGDLVTTCVSPHSRNRFVGQEIAKGRKLSQIIDRMDMIAEGVFTTKAAYSLAKKYKVEMPIVSQMHSVLYQGKSSSKALKDLMLRKKKSE